MRGGVFLIIIFFFLTALAFSQGKKELRTKSDSLEIIAPEDTLPKHQVVITDIFIIGNKKTKKGYILRELSVKRGDTIAYNQLRIQLNRDEEKVFNLRLFEESKATIIDRGDNEVIIELKVSERWFVWPLPIFRLADRNFNAWWNTRERDFDRLIYGITLDHSNIRGRGERLRLTAQFGFTRNWQIFYSIPYIDRQKKVGFATLFGFTEFKSIAYQSNFDLTTNRNEFDFINADSLETGLLRKAFSGAGAFTYRPNFFTRHGLTLGFSQNNVADVVASLNENYLSEGRTRQQYLWLSYQLIYDNRDLVYYPLKGSQFNLLARRQGIGIFNDLGIWSLEASYAKFFDLGNNFYFATRGQISTTAPFDQPFVNQQRLGFFRNFVRGYELSVVETPFYILNRNTVRKKLFNKEFKIRNITRLDQFAKLPLGLYLTAFVDTGWAEKYPNKISPFNNTLLLGTGVGLDIVTFYDVVIRLEYSYNLEKETNFFLNVRAAI